MNLLLAILVLAAVTLVGGAVVMWRKGARRIQVVLMVILAAIMLANVLIWTVPQGDGEAPVEQMQTLEH